MSVRTILEITVTDFFVCGKEKKRASMEHEEIADSIQGPKSFFQQPVKRRPRTVEGKHHCRPSPGFMSVRVNTKDPTLSVLFISTGTFRLSSVSQMKTTPLFMKTPSCLG